MKLKRLLAGVFTVLVTLLTVAKADPIGYIGPNIPAQTADPVTGP